LGNPSSQLLEHSWHVPLGEMPLRSSPSTSAVIFHLLEMARSSMVTRPVGSWEIGTWPYRVLLPRHAHGDTLTHKSPTPASVRLSFNVCHTVLRARAGGGVHLHPASSFHTHPHR